MTTYLIHHIPKSATQDTWAVSFSLPYIALNYARAGNGLWYVQTWLTAEQIKQRLAVLFDNRDELRIHALAAEEAGINGELQWLEGRLEDDAEIDFPRFEAPRNAWAFVKSVVSGLAEPIARGGERSSGSLLSAA